MLSRMTKGPSSSPSTVEGGQGCGLVAKCLPAIHKTVSSFPALKKVLLYIWSKEFNQKDD